MKGKNILFTDGEIVEFCKATKDTNELHNPDFMGKIGKRVIVPGMFALSSAINLNTAFLKTRANYIKVLFNTLLSSGDFSTLSAEPEKSDPSVVRLSAVNHKDTLSSNEDFSRMMQSGDGLKKEFQGILRRLPIDPWQTETFRKLIGTTDSPFVNFQFAVSYASHALLKSIDQPESDVEREIDRLINGRSQVSPFYQSLEIYIPEPFPVFSMGPVLDYHIHFEREKAMRLYSAYVRCESNGKMVFRSKYLLMGIPDRIIIRMAKDIHPVKRNP
jgi:hypothetical protein